ncbi:MAG: cytochrome P460 family protein [Paracoccaceae bacterium]
MTARPTPPRRLPALLAALALAACGTGSGAPRTPAPAVRASAAPASLDPEAREAAALYARIEDAMLAGYREGPKLWIPADRVADYRDWPRAHAAPARSGAHGGRYLLTRVNPRGAAAYRAYAASPSIPPGTVLAMESFSVEAGEPRPGPLYFMEKVEDGVSPETNDWYYYLVGADGVPIAADVASACNACHQEQYGDQGNLAYPPERVRVRR